MEDPVQAQVDAYNARDIDAFTAAYHADVVITDASGRAIMSGQETIRDEYGALFEASPDLRAEILGRVSAPAPGPSTTSGSRAAATPASCSSPTRWPTG